MKTSSNCQASALQLPDVDIEMLAFRISSELRQHGNHVDVIRGILRGLVGGVLRAALPVSTTLACRAWQDHLTPYCGVCVRCHENAMPSPTVPPERPVP